MKRIVIHAVWVCMLMCGVAVAQENDFEQASKEFRALVSELTELRDAEKLSDKEWSQISKELSRLRRKVRNKDEDAQIEMMQATSEIIIDLLEGMDDEEAEHEEGTEHEEIEIEVEENDSLAQEVERAKRAAAQEAGHEGEHDDDEEDRIRIRLNGKDLDLDVGNIEKMVEKLLGESGDLERLGEELGAWSEEHSGRWEDMAKDFEKAAELFGEKMEDWAENEIEPWAERYSERWEAWGERMEQGEFDKEEFGALMEENLKMLAELPVKDIYKQFLNEYEHSEIFNEEKMDELGDLIRDSVENAIEAVEENIDMGVMEQLLSGDNGQQIENMLSQLMQSEGHRKEAQEKAAKQYRRALAQAQEAARDAELQARDMAEAARRQAIEAQKQAEVARAQALRNADQMQADRAAAMKNTKEAARAQQDARIAELMARLEAEKAKRAEAEALLEEQTRLQEKNNQIEVLRKQMEALAEELDRLKKDKETSIPFAV